MKQATNSLRMGEQNRRLVLDLIRRQPIPRSEIASITHLTRASVSLITDELIESGLLRETPSSSSRVGRRPIPLEIIPDARYIAGVNIKRGEVDAGLIALGGDVVSSEVLAYGSSDAEDMLRRAVHSIRRQIEEQKIDPSLLLGVGVCAPGPLDAVSGVILNPPNCALWHGVPVAELLSEETGWPVHVENVSGALALEEQYFGLGRGAESFIAVQINEGIGAGIMIDGRLYRGARGVGSELGHISIQMDGPPCDCGNRGCLERYASIPAILNGSPYGSWKALVDCLDTDASAGALLDREADYLAHALISAVNLFDAEKIILLSDVAYGPEALLKRLNERVGPRVITRTSGDHPVVASSTESFVRTGAMACLNAFYQG